MDKWLLHAAPTTTIGASSETVDGGSEQGSSQIHSISECSQHEKLESNKEDSSGSEEQPTAADNLESRKKLKVNRSRISKQKIRKYHDNYLQYGFTFSIVDNEHRPQCVICSEVLANASLKPSTLLRHLKTKHTSVAKKSIEYFTRKRDELKGQVVLMKKPLQYQPKRCRHPLKFHISLQKLRNHTPLVKL